jgi:hypothetical protein
MQMRVAEAHAHPFQQFADLPACVFVQAAQKLKQLWVDLNL